MKENSVENPRKTLRQVAENPRQVKGTSEPEREGSQAKGTQKATKRPEDQPNRKGNSRGRKDRGSSERQEARIAKEETVAKKANKSSQGRYQEKEN